MHFKITKKSSKSSARVGRLRTAHGAIETPALVTVATQATVKALTNEHVQTAGSGLLICNTLHLHLKPGAAVVKRAGGLHKFMNWSGPLMTDSGGYQVFSLGFGRDHGVGKVLKQQVDTKVQRGQQPTLLRINDDGVEFTSYLDGRKLFLGPRESIRIQAALGADIIFAFDECTSPAADYEYTKHSLERTHRWAEICLKTKRAPGQALFGVVQGGRFQDLRQASAHHIGSLPFDGFGIGGEFGADKRLMSRMIRWVTAELPEDKPRHLLGIGHPEDIERVIRAGVDIFDCTVPTQYARHGTAFTRRGRLEISQSRFLKDLRPLDAACQCPVCRDYSRAYLCHLLRAKELTAFTLLSMHNLHFFNGLVARVRERIKKGEI